MDIPDAPWIRDAERNGADAAPDVYCPVCGEENPEYFYTEKGGIDVLGCSCCIVRWDPWDWMEDEKGRNG